MRMQALAVLIATAVFFVWIVPLIEEQAEKSKRRMKAAAIRRVRALRKTNQ